MTRINMKGKNIIDRYHHQGRLICRYRHPGRLICVIFPGVEIYQNFFAQCTSHTGCLANIASWQVCIGRWIRHHFGRMGDPYLTSHPPFLLLTGVTIIFHIHILFPQTNSSSCSQGSDRTSCISNIIVSISRCTEVKQNHNLNFFLSLQISTSIHW